MEKSKSIEDFFSFSGLPACDEEGIWVFKSNVMDPNAEYISLWAAENSAYTLEPETLLEIEEIRLKVWEDRLSAERAKAERTVAERTSRLPEPTKTIQNFFPMHPLTKVAIPSIVLALSAGIVCWSLGILAPEIAVTLITFGLLLAIVVTICDEQFAQNLRRTV